MKQYVVFATFCLLAIFTSAQNDSAPDEPANEYLPPTEPGTDNAIDTKVSDDGYRYRIIRRLKYRHRRDVSQEYLPPVQEPSQEYLPPIEQQPETKVADDGYRYKTVKRLRFRSRHRRDVSEIEKPSNEYLPPVEVELAPELKTILGDDGYRYRAVRRLKYRRHRREAEAGAPSENVVTSDAVDTPVNEYLPPTEGEAGKPEVKSAELANDGYRYKTVRRIKYRYRQ